MMQIEQSEPSSAATSSFETLVVSYQEDAETLAHRMNLHGQAVIANQGNSVDRRQFLLPHGGEVQVIETDTVGVGKNRNIALMNAHADICLFGDDDVIYHNDYIQTVLSAFERYPEADMIFFNLAAKDQDLYQIPQDFRVRQWNFLRFGTARVAFRLRSVAQAQLRFDERFGGGGCYLHGEDTIFFGHCLRAGLKLWAVADEIGTLTEDRESTWRNGYNRKYVHDQGALYKAMSPRLWPLWLAQDVLRRSRSQYHMSPRAAFKLMLKGTHHR